MSDLKLVLFLSFCFLQKRTRANAKAPASASDSTEQNWQSFHFPRSSLSALLSAQDLLRSTNLHISSRTEFQTSTTYSLVEFLSLRFWLFQNWGKEWVQDSCLSADWEKTSFLSFFSGQTPYCYYVWSLIIWVFSSYSYRLGILDKLLKYVKPHPGTFWCTTAKKESQEEGPRAKVIEC
jgi:hypothetical protein